MTHVEQLYKENRYYTLCRMFESDLDDCILWDHFLHVKSLAHLQRFEEVREKLAWIKDVLKSKPGLYWYFRGQVEEYLLDGEAAMHSYWKGIQEDPEFPTCYLHLALLYRKQNYITDALDVLQVGMSKPDACVDEFQFHIGVIHAGQHRYFEARECWKSALRIDPNYQEALHMLEDTQGLEDA